MNDDCLKLTVYFGESDRTRTQLLSDALLELFEQAGLRASVLLRGVEGFGSNQTLRTQRFLTLSEDLPLVAIGIDERERVERLLPDVTELVGGGLVTLERARLLHGRIDAVELPEELHEATKLSIVVGRDERIGDRPAHIVVVEHLRDAGLAGATVLLGVDGTVHGSRRRARFFSHNAGVPLLLVSVGAGAAVVDAIDRLNGLLTDPLLALERVRVCKRDGRTLAEPRHLPESDASGLGVWQKLMVHSGEQSRHAGHPLYIELIRRLREEGASGATAVRGIWGFSGDHRPHGDRVLAVRRRVPVVTTIVDRPDEIQRWFRVVDEVTDEAGLVTSEMVPAFHAVGPEARATGGLRLARLRY